MAEQWELYTRVIGGATAFVCYDHGLSGVIDRNPNTILLRVEVTLKDPDTRGLPRGAEHDALATVEDRLVGFLDQSGGCFLGRITTGGTRWLYAYDDSHEDQVAVLLRSIANDTGYSITFVRRPDPGREAYWRELFPTDAEWQIAQDLKVINALRESGDDLSRPRRIEHWVYFSDAEARDAFVVWAQREGYNVQSQPTQGDETSQFGVQVSHSGTPEINTISQHTVALAAKARELGGDYDGWETGPAHAHLN